MTAENRLRLMAAARALALLDIARSLVENANMMLLKDVQLGVKPMLVHGARAQDQLNVEAQLLKELIERIPT